MQMLGETVVAQQAAADDREPLSDSASAERRRYPSFDASLWMVIVRQAQIVI